MYEVSSDIYIYLTLAVALGGILLFLILFRKIKAEPKSEVHNAVLQQANAELVIPNRTTASRNARSRMRVTQAQRHSSDEEEENDEEVSTAADNIVLPEGKIGKKKLAKLQAKAEKRVMREAEEREREERKQREEKEAEQRKLEEQKQEEEEAKRLEQERKEQEQREKKEQEEYERMKLEFSVEEEGCEDAGDEEREQNLLRDFIDYIKENKVVILEDLASKFKIKTQQAIDRVNDLQKDGLLTGVTDDRGKFIYVTNEEMLAVVMFIQQRGRISISELAESSNTLINLTPCANVT